mmetsp:Transcript_74076/g.90935  ORF Transcript_74076/g.90935 Transcript_74076/m.90935 type:complete len:108 (-) Transcript_74076:327-650(-)
MYLVCAFPLPGKSVSIWDTDLRSGGSGGSSLLELFLSCRQARVALGWGQGHRFSTVAPGGLLEAETAAKGCDSHRTEFGDARCPVSSPHQLGRPENTRQGDATELAV